MQTPDSSGSTFSNLAQSVLSARFLRVAAWVLGACSLLLWLALILLFASGANKPPSQSIGPDFAAFYTGGTLFRNGESAQLYDFARQSELQQQLGIVAGKNALSAWVHPAHYAVFMAPFSALSPRTAYAIYAILMFACFALGIVSLRRVVPFLNTRSGVWISILALFSSPVYFSISAGQNTGLVFLLHCAILVSLAQKRDFQAGVFCALGLIKPHLFLFLLPLFIVANRTRALLGFAVVAIATIAFDLAVFGTDVFARNWAALQTPLYRNEEIIQAPRMFSWQSFWKLLIGDNIIASILGWSCALFVFAILCVWWRKTARENSSATRKPLSQQGEIEKTTSNDLVLLYAISVCAIVVVAPHLPVYDLGLLVLPALILLNRVLDFPTTQFVALRLTLLALVVLTALGEEFARQTHLQIVTVLVTLLVFLAMQMRNATRETSTFQNTVLST